MAKKQVTLHKTNNRFKGKIMIFEFAMHVVEWCLQHESKIAIVVLEVALVAKYVYVMVQP